ncbi:hypothetical protein BVRB_7g163980 [Beta vulgaris subsp. vulgaris]|nr:hypothetical protein BVRB_7g163980 [Beta vulgaris subsp. vulgaris]
MILPNNAQLGIVGFRDGIMGLGDPGMNNNMVQSAAPRGGGGMGIVGLGGGGEIGVPVISCSFVIQWAWQEQWGLILYITSFVHV